MLCNTWDIRSVKGSHRGSDGDLLIPDSDKYKFGADQICLLYLTGRTYTNATGAMKVATETRHCS